MFPKVSMVFLVLGLELFCSPVRAATADYKVIKTINLPGNVRWDYLTYDSASHRLFITRGDRVDVMNTSTMTLSGSIPGVAGIHGVAIANDLGKGYISNGKSGTVTVFSMDTLKVLGTVKADNDADAIVYDETTHRIFTANGDSGNLSVIDAISDKNIGSITLTGKPEFAAVDGKGKLFVNIMDKSQLDVIDTKNLKLLTRFEMSSVCKEPTGLSIDAERERLFSGCRNEILTVVDGNNGKILASLPTGKSTDATRFDAGLNQAFSSNGDGTLTVIGADSKNSYKVLQNVKTMVGARTMTLDSDSHTIYLVSADIDHIDLPTPDHPRPRPQFKDNSFTVITVGAP